MSVKSKHQTQHLTGVSSITLKWLHISVVSWIKSEVRILDVRYEVCLFKSCMKTIKISSRVRTHRPHSVAPSSRVYTHTWRKPARPHSFLNLPCSMDKAYTGYWSLCQIIVWTHKQDVWGDDRIDKKALHKSDNRHPKTFIYPSHTCEGPMGCQNWSSGCWYRHGVSPDTLQGTLFIRIGLSRKLISHHKIISSANLPTYLG